MGRAAGLVYGIAPEADQEAGISMAAAVPCAANAYRDVRLAICRGHTGCVPRGAVLLRMQSACDRLLASNGRVPG